MRPAKGHESRDIEGTDTNNIQPRIIRRKTQMPAITTQTIGVRLNSRFRQKWNGTFQNATFGQSQNQTGFSGWGCVVHHGRLRTGRGQKCHVQAPKTARGKRMEKHYGRQILARSYHIYYAG
jgi:hypothetical protein